MSNNSIQPTMTDLLKNVDTENLEIGQIISGEIVFVVKNQVLIQIPNVGVGIIRGKDLYNEEYIGNLKAGQTVEAAIISLDNELGVLELSFKAIGHDKVWAEINNAFENRDTIEAKVRDVNKGGFIVKVKGVDGFLPASLLSPTHAIKQVGVEDKSLMHQMKKYIGQVFNVKILNVNTENETVIVSEKAVSDEIVTTKLSKFKVGDVVDGVVAGAVDFGLFVKFDDYLDGLVHISEIAWKKVDDPKKEYQAGDQVKVKIIDIDKDNRINLSIKQTTPNPWNEFIKSAQPGQRFMGRVVKIVSYGAIVVNEETEIQGLCHISQISEQELESPASIHEILKIGDVKEFTILSVESDEKLYLTLLELKKAKKIQELLVEKQKEEMEKSIIAKDEEAVSQIVDE
jgi:small subunit ribosomal protein S1